MLYTVTIGLSAFLLFLIQPLISKVLLPVFGGGASIWITSLVFFQGILLAGYAGAHLFVRILGLRRHLYLVAALLIASVINIPVAAPLTFGTSWPPAAALLFILLGSVGLPCFVLAMTSPTLQYWIARDTGSGNRNPYVEYGFSNLGSLLGLLAYPFALEIFLTNPQQSWLWSLLYAIYVALMIMTMTLFLRRNRHIEFPRPAFALSGTIRGRWLVLAMIPSALLLVTTHYLTLDVINLPLLWVAPLAVYLTTFILCFLKPSLSRPSRWRTMAGVMSILALIVANHGFLSLGFAAQIFCALTCLFIISMICHGDLERSKPDQQDLTAFYVQVAAGGVAGSILVGLIAPLLFDTTLEFALVLIAALYYVVSTGLPASRRALLLFRGGIAVSVVAALVVRESTFGETIYLARSFYSTYAVRETADPILSRRLVAGTHVHGEQLWLPEFQHMPVAYYHEGTGAAQIMNTLEPDRVALIGLGVGTIVEFAGADTVVDIYELDPMVVDIATDFFTVLSQSPATINTIIGDGRIQIRNAPDASYDVIVLDAFTSGSIPTHLLTVEAAQAFATKLDDDGVLAYHISNRHVDLLPVLSGIADATGMSIYVHESSGERKLRMFPATWVLLAPDPSVAQSVTHATSGWEKPPQKKIIWRDDFSNVWSVLR